MNNPAQQQNADSSLLVHFLTIRKAVGIIGMILPLMLVLGVKFLSECGTLQNSISDYYYTKMGHYMTGTLCAVSLFMFTYKGYEKKDLVAGKLAALFALGVAFMPVTNYLPLSACKVLVLEGTKTVNAFHFTSAALLFFTFAYFSLFLFTKTSGNVTNRKRIRNTIYKICGVLIVLSILSILLYSLIPALYNKFEEYKPIFWLETLALEAFGFSWLVKGEGLLGDAKEK